MKPNNYMDMDGFREARHNGAEDKWLREMEEGPQSESRADDCVYFAGGSGYSPGSGPSGPVYFDEFGNT